MSPLNNYPNIHNQQVQSPQNSVAGQQLPQVFSNHNLNGSNNIIKSPIIQKYSNGLGSSMGIGAPVSQMAGNTMKYNSSKKVTVIPAHLVNMNASMGPSASVIDESQSLINMTEDSRDQFGGFEKKHKLNSTMNSIDNSLHGFQ